MSYFSSLLKFDNTVRIVLKMHFTAITFNDCETLWAKYNESINDVFICKLVYN